MTNPQISLEDAVRASFPTCLKLIWRHLGLPPPTKCQLDIARYMQDAPRRAMIMAFRGVGKSWMYAAFIVWLGFRNPNINVVVVSASKQLADSLSIFVKRLIAEIPIFQHLKPRDDQRDSNIAFDFGPAKANKDPSVKSVGITGQITGSRADYILADDIENPNNSATESGREKLLHLVTEFDSVVKPDTGSVMYLGTPQSFMSIYKHLPERGYEIRVWPAHIPGDPAAYGGHLAPYIYQLIEAGAAPGDRVDPERFSEKDLAERRLSLGRANYQLQFMLDTSDADAMRFPLKLRDLVVANLDPKSGPAEFMWGPDRKRIVQDVEHPGLPGDKFHWAAETKGIAEYEGAIMYVDPSGRGKDETAYAVVKHLYGNLFLTAVGGFHGGYDDATLKALVKTGMDQNVNLMIVESNFGDGMFTRLLHPFLKPAGAKFGIEEVTVGNQMSKEARIIETLEPVLMQHRLVVDHQLIEWDYATAKTPEGDHSPQYSLWFQMTRLQNERGALKHDDRLDSVAGAVRYWTDQMALSNSQAVKRAHDKALEEDLKTFMKTGIHIGRGREMTKAHLKAIMKDRGKETRERRAKHVKKQRNRRIRSLA